MKINWALRLKNRAWLAALLATGTSFVFVLLSLFGVTSPVGEENILSAISTLLTLLAALGVVIDPTTPGVRDTDEVMEEK